MIILVGRIVQIIGERNKLHTKLTWNTWSKRSRGTYIRDGGIGNTDRIFNQCSLRGAWVCGRSLVGIEGLNPAGVMDVCLLWALCVVRVLCDGLISRPEESYRLWRVWVLSRKVIEDVHAQYDCRAMRKRNGLSVNCIGLDRDQYRPLVCGFH
jgi:hypothetical protein